MEKLQDDIQKLILEIDGQMEAWDVVHSHSMHYFNAIITCAQRLDYLEKVNEGPNSIDLLSSQNTMNILLSSKQTINIKNFCKTISRNHIRYSKIIQKMKSLSKENNELIENYFNSGATSTPQLIPLHSPSKIANTPNRNRKSSNNKTKNNTQSPSKNSSPNRSNLQAKSNNSPSRLQSPQNNLQKTIFGNDNLPSETALEEALDNITKLTKTSIFMSEEDGEEMNEFSYSLEVNYPDIYFTRSVYHQICQSYSLQFTEFQHILLEIKELVGNGQTERIEELVNQYERQFYVSTSRKILTEYYPIP